VALLAKHPPSHTHQPHTPTCLSNSTLPKAHTQAKQDIETEQAVLRSSRSTAYLHMRQVRVCCGVSNTRSLFKPVHVVVAGCACANTHVNSGPRVGSTCTCAHAQTLQQPLYNSTPCRRHLCNKYTQRRPHSVLKVRYSTSCTFVLRTIYRGTLHNSRGGVALKHTNLSGAEPAR
jgi:hypothetical protein